MRPFVQFGSGGGGRSRRHTGSPTAAHRRWGVAWHHGSSFQGGAPSSVRGFGRGIACMAFVPAYLLMAVLSISAGACTAPLLCAALLKSCQRSTVLQSCISKF